jgi:hypothetical protein
VINRPISEVARYAGDPDNAPLWYLNIKSVEWLTPRPAPVGSRIAFVAQFLGGRLAYTYELVEFIPGVRLVMRTSEGPFPDGDDDLHVGVARQREHTNDTEIEAPPPNCQTRTAESRRHVANCDNIARPLVCGSIETTPR